MSVVDLKIETTRCNQGESLRSKDWELVRKKVFQEEDLLWNDSQFNINEAKDEEKSSNLITALQNQEKNMKENNQLKQQQIRNSNLNNNSRRLNIFSKRSSSRSRIIELDISNINEVTYFNKLAKEEMLVIQNPSFQHFQQSMFLYEVNSCFAQHHLSLFIINFYCLLS
ncbi:hypothetical protein ABPG74_019121 [Tetrahymena malaccensis]